MKTFLDKLAGELERWDVVGVTKTAHEMRAEIERLQGQHDALMGEVPFWARAAFFLDTEEEFEARGVRARITELEERIVALGEDRESRMRKVGEQLAPFGVALDVERCVVLARGVLEGKGSTFDAVGDVGPLRDALAALTRRVIDTWAPGFERARLRAMASDRASCESAALGAPNELELDDWSCWRPLDAHGLVGLVAERLIERNHFAREDDIERLDEELADTKQELAEASAGVSLGDRINVFGSSPAEVARDEASTEIDALRARRELARELMSYEVAAAIEAMPPLRVARLARVVWGACATLEQKKVRRIAPDGHVGTRKAVAHAATMIAGASMLRGAIARAFPGMPQPATLLGKRPASILPSARDELFASVYDALDASGAPAILRMSMIHASMAGLLHEEKELNAQDISPMDRLVFWSDTEAEARERTLEAREHWHLDQLGARSRQLLGHAASACSGHPVLGMNMAAIDATVAIDAIHTDSGQSSFPKSCSVYGQGAAYEALSRIESHLRGHFNTTGTRRDLMHAVSAAIRRGAHAAPSNDEVFRPLSYDELVARMASALAQTDFVSHFDQLTRLESKLHARSSDLEEVESSISLWDKINVFSKTEDEQARDDLRQEMGTLHDQKADFEYVDGMFERALHDVYPPAELAYRVGGVRHAVSQIRAVCRSTTVTVGSGDNRRTETRYYCALVGHSEATDSVRNFNRLFVSAWGELPGQDEILTRWAARTQLSDGVVR